MAHKDSKYPYISSPTGGVKPLAIRGVFEDERYRISEEYTNEERMWRKQWYKDQILAPDEPKHVPELEKMLKNPIRRFFSAPFKFMEAQMIPIFGATVSNHTRFLVPKILALTGFIYVAWYHLKYNQADWTRYGGWHVNRNRPTFLPGDPGYPRPDKHTKPSDYEDRRGFKERTVYKD